MTVIETSKITFIVPNFLCHVSLIALTNDSPGSMATFAITSKYTPIANTKQPIIRNMIENK